MKKLFGLPVIISLALFCSCQKQQTEEERKTEIERQVQERLTAERQAQSEQQLAQRQAELDAREKALAEKQRAAESAPVVEASETPLRASRTDASGNVATASYSTFYRKLEPYGVWRETSNYGYVWQPREAEPLPLVASLHQRPLDLHRRGLDLDIGRAVRLGNLPLRALDAVAQHRMDLGSRR
jgi:hypothetical protein